MFVDATKAAAKVSGHEKEKTTLLLATCYEQDDLPGCRRHLQALPEDDPDTLVNKVTLNCTGLH